MGMMATEIEPLLVKYPYERYSGDLEGTRWRAEFADAWDNQPDCRFFMLEWARRHRKTSDALTMLVRDCLTHKEWVSLVVAPYLVQSREIVWDDPKMLFAILPHLKSRAISMAEDQTKQCASPCHTR